MTIYQSKRFIIDFTPDLAHGNVDEFVKKYNSDKCTIDVSDMRNDTKGYLWGSYKKNKVFTKLNFMQNVEVFWEMYVVKCMKPETMYKESNLSSIITISGIETIRKCIKEHFPKYTKEQQEKSNYNSRSSVRLMDVAVRLQPAEDEIIRMYLAGISSVTMAPMFNCSEDKIRSIIKANGYFTKDNIDKVKKVGNTLTSYHAKNRSDEDKLKIHNKTQATRKINGSSEKTLMKTRQILSARYGEGIINWSQVPHIRDKQQRYRYVPYTFNSGYVCNVQGYEPIALKELELLGYDENDINLRKSYRYFNMEKNQMSVYFADIVLMELSKVIEVKSVWTIKKCSKKNESILKHMIENSIDFEFWVYAQPNKARSDNDKVVIRTMEQFLEFVG